MKKYEIILWVCALLSSVSCKESNRDHIVALIHEWEGKEVLFPANLVFTIQGKDTVDYFKRNTCKIVTYVDSIGCTSCKLRLPAWKEFIDVVDSLCQDSVQFLFFFYPQKKAEIYRTLRIERFDYPVCIDEDDSLNKLNKFPSDMAFQTFLLNKNNGVVAIGNPVHNPKVRELYLNILQDKDVNSVAGSMKTTIRIGQRKISLGEFDWQQDKSIEIILENTGKKPLVIDDIITSCGCVTVNYPKKPIRPSDIISLQVTYKAEQPEHFDKTIKVYCNAKSSPLLLKLTGDAK